MTLSDPQLLLVAAVLGVGVLHTMVPDHWVPITLVARQRGWSVVETARAALLAGTGHVLSTLLIAVVVWVAGVAAAKQFGGVVDTLASLALIGFGGWIAISSLLDMRKAGGGHGHSHGHSHGAAEDGAHVHGDHDHGDHDHGDHSHGHHHSHPHDDHDAPARPGSRTALVLILGSSPMVEGIPAFFAAGRYGAGLIILMSLVFAAATIATYVVLCIISVGSLKRVSLGPLEKYGEVLSGGFIALIGVAFWLWPLL
jgi:ABC-type nickel/cobalt efflux system permease component RcnA